MIIKSKIYLKPQEKPPKGARIQRGPRGGMYYETTAKIKSKQKHKIADTKQLFESKNSEEIYQKARDAILNDIQKKEHFSKETMDKTQDILRYWDNRGYEIEEAAPIWYAAFLENNCAGFPSKIRKKIKKKEVDIDVTNFLRHMIRRTKKLLTQKYGDTPIILYRGIDAKNAKFIGDIPTSNEKFKVKSRALESWTTDISTAKVYAGSDGITLKTTVKADQVGYFGGFCLPNFTSRQGMEFSLNLSEEFQIVERAPI